MNPVRFVIFFAIGALTLILALMSIRLWEDLQRLRTADGENLQWTILQLDTETARLHAALLEQVMLPEPDAAIVDLRTSIAISRIGLVQEGNARSTFADEQEALDLLDELERYALEAASVLDAEAGLSPAALVRLVELTRDIRPAARRLALIGNRIGARRAEERRRALAGQLRRTGLLAVAVIAALGGAFVILDRMLRNADQRDRDLRASSDRLASTIGASLDAIVTTDARGHIIGFNAEAERMFGWAAQDILGLSLEGTLAPSPVETVAGHGSAEWRWSNHAGKGRVEVSARRVTGEQFPAEMNVAEVQEDSGGLLICYFRDISDRKINEQRLVHARDRAERLDRAKTRFLTIMSHEMRTPLNGIMGILDLMRTSDLTPEQDRYARVAIGSAELLLQQANEALDVTRVESGEIALASETFSLSEMLERAVELLEPLAIRKGLQIGLRVEPGMRMAFLGDEDRLRQIVTNLIGNGIKFTTSGAITVTLSGIHGRDMTDAEISVSDTGIGIPEDQHETVFEDFVVLAKPGRGEDRGDGLGLSISRRIARRMGGELSVTSVEGQGSTFTLTVPLRRTSERPPQQVIDAPMFADRPGARHSQRILVVEDNDVSRSILSEMLGKMGHDVTSASDGSEGLDTAERQQFDLIVMDISMPIMDGLETTHRIRTGAGPNRDSRIVGLTAHGPEEFRDKADAVGMSDLATKPLRFDRLHDLLGGQGGSPPVQGLAFKGIERDVFEDIVNTLGRSRVGEMANRLRSELDLVLRTSRDAEAPPPAEEIEKALHNLQGAMALLGFRRLRGQLDKAHTVWKERRAGDPAMALRELQQELEAISRDMDGVLDTIREPGSQDA